MATIQAAIIEIASLKPEAASQIVDQLDESQQIGFILVGILLCALEDRGMRRMLSSVDRLLVLLEQRGICDRDQLLDLAAEILERDKESRSKIED